MSEQTRFWTCRLDSPVGPLTLKATADALIGLAFASAKSSGPEDRADDPEVSNPILRQSVRQVREYFARQRTQFDVPLDPTGTAFQRTVWDELRKIPFGATISYGELARRVGNPRASRAVGLANGRNPIAILIPCHRVIGADGTLTGFGGGLACKQTLLELEQAGVAGRLFEAIEMKGTQAAGM